MVACCLLLSKMAMGLDRPGLSELTKLWSSLFHSLQFHIVDPGIYRASTASEPYVGNARAVLGSLAQINLFSHL